MRNKINTIDEYIGSFPPDVQKILEKIRATIKKSAPDATEAITYQMPTFKFHGNLVHFAAYKNHIGFYPTASAIEAFKKNLTAYKCSKGAIQFSIEKPVPLELLAEIVKYRIKEIMEKVKK